MNKQGSDIAPPLAHAQKVIVDDTTKGDLQGAYVDAIQDAAI